MFACSCCGSENGVSRQSEFEICTVCHWEDDPTQFFDPDYAGGANELSLNECRDNGCDLHRMMRRTLLTKISMSGIRMSSSATGKLL